MSERFKVEELTDKWGTSTGWRIVDTETGLEGGRDGGEPDDQLLIRDWAWVPKELNALAATIDQLRADLAMAQAEVLRLRYDLERADEYERFLRCEGYRRCDIAACNCGSWHGGYSTRRSSAALTNLRERAANVAEAEEEPSAADSAFSPYETDLMLAAMRATKKSIAAAIRALPLEEP